METLYKEIESFARDFINGNRTPERKLLISRAYKQLTGNNLKKSCSTCYIEAIFKIIEKMKAPKEICRYRLKKGARLRAFSDESKTCTNDNLTDELAEWHLARNPGLAGKFEVMPKEPVIYNPYADMSYNDLRAEAVKVGIKAKGSREDLIEAIDAAKNTIA